MAKITLKLCRCLPTIVLRRGVWAATDRHSDEDFALSAVRVPHTALSLLSLCAARFCEKANFDYQVFCETFSSFVSLRMSHVRKLYTQE